MEEKSKKIIFILGGVVLLFLFGIVAYNIFIAKKSGMDILKPPILGTTKEVLPPIPDLQMKYSIFNTITSMFGSEPKPIDSVPVNEGDYGKENPFEPFEGFEKDEELIQNPTPNAQNSQTPNPADVGQGTK